MITTVSIFNILTVLIRIVNEVIGRRTESGKNIKKWRYFADSTEKERFLDIILWVC